MSGKPVENQEPMALVMKGGGVKGIALAGAIEVLENYYEFDMFVGTSAGAISAVLMAAGYSGKELVDEMLELKFKEFPDRNLFTGIWSLLRRGGWHSGNPPQLWIRNKLGKKLNKKLPTLSDLPKRFVAYANWDRAGLLVMDSEGINRQLEGDIAARFSMSIPYFFEPQDYSQGKVYDGGILANFPVLEYREENPERKNRFIGLYLGDPSGTVGRNSRGTLSDILKILFSVKDNWVLAAHEEKIVFIDPYPIGTVDFDLKPAERQFLLNVGRLAAYEFLAKQNKGLQVTLDYVDKLRAKVVAQRASIVRQRKGSKIRRQALVFMLLVLLLLSYWTSSELAAKPPEPMPSQTPSWEALFNEPSLVRSPPPNDLLRKERFISSRITYLLDSPDSRVRGRQLLWGDRVFLLDQSQSNGYVKIWARWREGWVKATELQKEPLLEFNFLNVGSESGCLVVTTDSRLLIVDATSGDSMLRFLRWRLGEESGQIDAVISTHCDSNSWGGIEDILNDKRYKINSFIHNGIVRRGGRERLGPKVIIEGRAFLSELPKDRDDLKKIVSSTESRSTYVRFLKKLLDHEESIPMVVSVLDRDEWLPGFGEESELPVQILGPVSTEDSSGKPVLPVFGSDAETVNGNSLMLKMDYRQVRVLLAGDTGKNSQELILSERGSEVLHSDVAKIRLRSDGDMSLDFLEAVNPLATIVALSLDAAPVGLNILGRAQRLEKSPILASDGQYNQYVLQPLRDRIREIDSRLPSLSKDASNLALAERSAIDEILNEALATFCVTVVRTDGRDVLLAECRRYQPIAKVGSKGLQEQRWRTFFFQANKDGKFTE